MLTLIYFILILGIIVLVHEFGHFIFSKLFGVHVFEFSIGMGPRLFGTKKVKGKTQYNVRALPIGGFVALAGEDATEKDPEVPDGAYLYQKPVWQRFIIMAAGVFNNFVLAIILLFMIGIFHGAVDLTPTVSNLDETGAMYEAGIREGDLIKSINGHSVSTLDDAKVYLTIENNGGKTKFVMERDGKELKFNVTPVETLTFTKLDKSSNLYKVGIRDGDTLKYVNGQKITGEKSLREYLKIETETNETEIKVERDGEEITFNSADIKAIESKTYEKSYKYGIIFEQKIVKGFFPAVNYTFTQFKSYFKQIFITFEYLFKGKVGVEDLSGPVGIYTVVGKATEESVILNLATLTALLCVNVGFINILPFPAFDGGRILFLIIEKIRKKPVDPKIENAVNSVGFILLMLLVLFITVSDVNKIFNFWS